MTREPLSTGELERLLGVGVFTWAQETSTLTVSEHFLEIWQPPFALETLDDLIRCVHPTDATSMRAAFDRVIDIGAPFELEVRLSSEPAVRRVVTLRGERLSDPYRLVAFVKEREPHALDPGARTDALQRVAEDFGRDFLDAMSAITCHASFALEAIGDDDAAADVREVLTAAYRATGLTEALINSSAQHRGAQLIDVREFARSVEPVLAGLGGNAVNFAVQSDQDLLPVVVDPDALEQAVVTAAAQGVALLDAGGRLLLRLEQDQSGDKPLVLVRLEVFPDEGELSVHDGGWVPSCAALLSPNDARLDVHADAASWGVSISLPSPSHDFESRVTRRVSVPSALSVLVVEDEGHVRRAIVRILKGAGFRVVAAADGREALRVLEAQAHNFHLMMTDVVMPHMSGWDLAARVKTKYPSVNIVVMTGYSAPYGRESTANETPDDSYGRLSKPFTPKKLLASVRESLGLEG